MANWETGTGKFGLKIQYTDGDVEKSWHTSSSERDRVLKQMNNASNVKHIDKIKR